MKTKLCFAILFLTMISDCALAQLNKPVNAIHFSNKVTLLLDTAIYYPFSLLLKNVSTSTALRLTFTDTLITDIRISDSADSLYRSDLMKKRKQIIKGLQVILKGEKLKNTIALIPLIFFVGHDNVRLTSSPKATRQMFTFDGLPCTGQITLLPEVFIYKTYSQ